MALIYRPNRAIRARPRYRLGRTGALEARTNHGAVQQRLFGAAPDRPDAGSTWYSYFQERFFPVALTGARERAKRSLAALTGEVLDSGLLEDPEVAAILGLRHELAGLGLPMPEEGAGPWIRDEVAPWTDADADSLPEGSGENGEYDEEDLAELYSAAGLWWGGTYVSPSALIALPEGTPKPRTEREAEDAAEAFLYFVLNLPDLDGDVAGLLPSMSPAERRGYAEPEAQEAREARARGRRRRRMAEAEVRLGQRRPVDKIEELTRLVRPIEMGDAYAFVAAHHSALPDARERGDYLALGLVYGAQLAAVAIVSTPSGRDEDQERIIDVSRIASDGTVRGASSALMRWVLKHARQINRSTTAEPLVVTYSLLTEQGTTYKALMDEGLRPVRLTRGTSASGSRAGATGTALMDAPKLRWEAGPDAAPARPELVDLWRAVLPVAEGRALERRHLQPLTEGALAELPRVLQAVRPVADPPKLRGLDKGQARSALVRAWGAQ